MTYTLDDSCTDIYPVTIMVRSLLRSAIYESVAPQYISISLVLITSHQNQLIESLNCVQDLLELGVQIYVNTSDECNEQTGRQIVDLFARAMTVLQEDHFHPDDTIVWVGIGLIVHLQFWEHLNAISRLISKPNNMDNSAVSNGYICTSIVDQNRYLLIVMDIGGFIRLKSNFKNY